MNTPLLLLLTLSLLHFPFSLSATAEPVYRPVEGFPHLPDGMQFGAVASVEMNADGNLLVFHRSEEPILVFTPEGRYLRSFGAGMFDSAHGLRCDPAGAIWTTDNKNHTVVKFSPAGKVLLTLGKRDVKGEDTSHFNRPADIAFAKSGDLFIADGYGNSRVVRCDRNGKFILAWGKKGVGEGEFDLPHAVRIDSKGLVYVGDRENDRVQVFNQEGEYIRQFGGFAPYGMHITPDDLLFVADGRANKVIKMTLTGEVLDEWGSQGTAPGQFAMPHGITVDKDGAVYVAEVGNKRIQKFVRVEPAKSSTPANAGIAPASGDAGSRHALEIKQVVAVENVCAWPNLTLLPDGTIAAILFNQPSHGQGEGDIDCWASPDGLKWERRSTVTRHGPNTIRMNHAAGVARNGDLVVLCSGWTNEKQPERPKQAPFRDAVLRPWVLRSADGGRTWEKRDAFPSGDSNWTEYIPFGDIWTGEDGALHTSCYQGEYLDPAKASKTKGWRSWHFRSDDDGWTWSAVSIIGSRHNETDLFPLGGTSWLAAARVERLELIRSDDNGATWGEPQPVTERNEINGHLTRLKDGRLLLTYGVRGIGRRGVCAKLSRDDGRTWGEPVRLADATADADCGYPSSVQLADGTIVTAWYANKTPAHDGYHMGVTTWKAPAVKTAGTSENGRPHPFNARPQPWQRRAEPILSALTTEQDWCKVVCYSPTVIHHDGKLRMWYLGTSTATRKANTALGYAESDDGITWHPHASNPILTGDDIPWGQLIQTPHVLFDTDESLYKMWFVSGYPRTIDERGRVTELDQHLGYAVSPDGLHWDVHPDPVYESGRSPSVIKEGPAAYRMWMGSLPGPEEKFGGLYSNIYAFTSIDGIHWKRAALPVITPGGIISTAVYPFVHKEDDTYYMWYGGHVEDGRFELFCAKSPDGSAWEIDHERAAFPARDGKSAFDSRYTSTPCVVAMPDRYLLYYSARDWITEYTDGDGVKHRDGASPYAHIGVAVIPRESISPFRSRPKANGSCRE